MRAGITRADHHFVARSKLVEKRRELGRIVLPITVHERDDIAASATVAVSSVEPSSTTITSASGYVALAVVTTLPMAPASFLAGITIDSELTGQYRLRRKHDHNTRRDRGANDAGHIWPHGVHQQEVMRVSLDPDLVGDASGHRYG